MKIWIDDLRPAPDSSWLRVLTSAQAIAALEHMKLQRPRGEFTLEEISFDHDLGGNDTTRPVLLWMVENEFWPTRRIFVHTANPVGRDWLVGTAQRYAPESVQIGW